MSDAPLSQADQDNIFSQLNPQDVEEFHHNYQLWQFEQRIAALRAEIDDLQRRLATNRETMQQVAPSPIALATLARLQMHGVNDPVLLDHLLARGDEWLDRTIQRLDYCERMGLIGNDYTKWCAHALEGAYDWIDSLSEAGSETAGETPQAAGIAASDETTPQTTEEMLLQKLMSDEDDEPTYKMAAVPITPVLPEEDTPDDENAEDSQPETLPDIEPAPSEQYELSADLEEMTPVENNVGSSSVQAESVNAQPESSANIPAAPPEPETAAIETRATQPAIEASKTPLPPRPKRKRNLWQKLVHKLVGR